MTKQILLVDNDTLLRQALKATLESAGYHLRMSSSADEGLAQVRQDPPDLVLLAMDLPSMDGLTVLHKFLGLGDIPLLCLTTHPSPQDEMIALALGADDYIVKPVHPGVILARVQNTLRHYDRLTGPRAHPGVLSVGDLTVDLHQKRVTVAGRPVRLPPHAFHLLYALSIRQGEVVLTNELLAHVWGAKSPGEDVLYVHMRTLRERLEADPKCPQRIITVYGVGYKLVPQGI